MRQYAESRAVLCRPPLALLVLVGCFPVGTLVGRPAAVVLDSSEIRSLGGGVYLLEMDDGIWYPIPNLYYGRVEGLGHGADTTLAFNNLHAELILRWQAMGHAEGEVERSLPVDVSVEAGASGIFWVYGVGWNAHLGVNLSLPTRGATPYISYRRYWGESIFIMWELSGEMDMVWVGLDFALRGGAGRRMALEAFYGWPRQTDGDATWGANVVFRWPASTKRPAPTWQDEFSGISER